MTHGAANFCRLIAASQEQLRAWDQFEIQQSKILHSQWMFLISAAAIVLLSALVSYLFAKRRQHEFWQDSSTRLFHDLCQAHQLEFASRRLLKKLASARGVESAADLFVEPRYFNPVGLPPALQSSAHELQQLQHALFAPTL